MTRDGQRFDELTRAFASVASRRRVLKTLTGGTLAVASALLGIEPASAACRAHGKPCDKGRQCCSRSCSRRGKCICPASKVKCGTRSCCLKGQGCVNGICKLCSPGATQACYTGPEGTQDVGVCQGGTMTCRADGTFGPCEGEVTPTNDVCDDEDNDCDGVIDIPDSCTGGKFCDSGTCRCPNGQHECNGNCVRDDAVATCGNRCQPCPGDGQRAAIVRCQNGTCTFECSGRNYDVNGIEADGCERFDGSNPGFSEGTATFLGGFGCSDSPSRTIQGQIVSDARTHTNPTVDGVNPGVGAAPEVWKVHAQGGTFCLNDLDATVSTNGRGSAGCYRLRVYARANPGAGRDASFGGTQTGRVTLNYQNSDEIIFWVEKTCGTNVREDVTYTINYHL